MTKNKNEIEAFLLRLICELDYDIYKEYETPEDPEYGTNIDILIDMMEEFLEE